MTNEEWDRKTEFLLNQQAKFDAEMHELKQAQKKTEKIIARAAEMISDLASLTIDGFKLTDGKIRELTESQKELTESQKDTEKKLKELAALVDRLLRGGQQGQLGAET